MRHKGGSHGAGGPAGAEPGSGAYVPGGHRSSTVRGSYMRKESAGLDTGLTKCAEFDSEALSFPRYDGARDPINGNAPDRPLPYSDSAVSVTSKGNKFSIC